MTDMPNDPFQFLTAIDTAQAQDVGRKIGAMLVGFNESIAHLPAKERFELNMNFIWTCLIDKRIQEDDK